MKHCVYVVIIALTIALSACSLHIPLTWVCKECGRSYATYQEASRCHHAIVYEVVLWIGSP